MAKYRKKPIVVEAELYKIGMENGFDRCDSVTCQIDRNFGWECSTCKLELGRPYLNTRQGKVYISKGDMIITQSDGEKYPCNPINFEQTYELIEDEDQI